jgi:low affinity Fe/Cu permease
MAREASGFVSRIGAIFDEAATSIAGASGRPAAFATALAVVLAWAASGSVFHYSDKWLLIIGTGTTIVTFLMVFVIQASQNRDSAAIQVKLDELIRSSGAKNTFMGIERRTKEEIRELKKKHKRQAK